MYSIGRGHIHSYINVYSFFISNKKVKKKRNEIKKKGKESKRIGQNRKVKLSTIHTSTDIQLIKKSLGYNLNGLL